MNPFFRERPEGARQRKGKREWAPEGEPKGKVGEPEKAFVNKAGYMLVYRRVDVKASSGVAPQAHGGLSRQWVLFSFENSGKG